MPSQHDADFKRLFAYPELVHALLALVPDCPADTASGYARLNSGFVSSSSRQRTADMVWRVYCGGALFYLLLEFQSTVDRHMGQRMKVYSGLLSQEISILHKGREPFDLLPVVVYSGRRKWPPASNVAADWLKPWHEGEAFVLVDEEVADGSVIADVIRLVRAESVEVILAAEAAILAWANASQELCREIARIANERCEQMGLNREEIMTVRKKAVAPLKLTDHQAELVWRHILNIYELWKDDPEVLRLMEAKEAAHREGAERGMKEGREIGFEQGRKEGREEGREVGREEGREEGRAAAFRQLLGKFCEQRGVADRAASMLAVADPAQLENWLHRVMAGEPLEEVLGEGGP